MRAFLHRQNLDKRRNEIRQADREIKVSNHHLSNEKIQIFWAWFAAVAEELRANHENPELLHQLDLRIADLGAIAWELGPGSGSQKMLAISPDGDAELLPVTKHIVSLAPKLPDWEFLWARPARRAPFQFSITRQNGTEYHIDARGWRYVLFRFSDGTFDIVLEEKVLEAITDDDQYTAAVVLLDGLVGEDTRLLRFREIEPVIALSPKLEAKANPIIVLPKHLGSLS